MIRFRRLRQNEVIRNLVRETLLNEFDLIAAFTVVKNNDARLNKGVFSHVPLYTVETLKNHVHKFSRAKGCAVYLIVTNQNDYPQMIKAVKEIREDNPDILLIADMSFFPSDTRQQNKLVDQLVKSGVSGLSFINTSFAVLKRVREYLERQKYIQTLLICDDQTVTAELRDKEKRKAVLEAIDMILVEPALPRLDEIRGLKKLWQRPVLGLHHHEQYASSMAAAKKKWVNEKDIMLESLTAIKRSGADAVISFANEKAIRWVKHG